MHMQDALATSLAAADDTAKLLEERFQLLTLQVAEEFQASEEQLQKHRASVAAAASQPVDSQATIVRPINT